MNKAILSLFIIASVIAISYAYPAEHEHGTGDLEDSFGSLTHHTSGSSVDGVAHAAKGEDEVSRQKRLISIRFGGYGGYGGGYGGYGRRRYYGGYGGYGGYGRRRFRGYGGYYGR